MARLPADPDQVQMSFGEHLEELRRRLLYAICGTAVVSAVTFIFGKQIVAWLCQPLAHAQAQAQLPPQTVTMTVMAGFMVYIKVSLLSAAIIAAPWIIYQIWQFVAVGLYRSERRAVLLLAPFSTLMTALGVAFAYKILLPLSLGFLIYFSTTYPPIDAGKATWVDHVVGFAKQLDPSTWSQSASPLVVPPSAADPSTGPPLGGLPDGQDLMHIAHVAGDPPEPVEGQWWLNTRTQELRTVLAGRIRAVPLSSPTQNLPLIELGQYISFVLYMVLATVIAFQLPVVMLVLGWTGLVAPDSLTPFRKHAVFVAFVAGALITPTGDPLSMTLLAAPLYLLFEMGLLAMRLVQRQPSQEE